MIFRLGIKGLKLRAGRRTNLRDVCPADAAIPFVELEAPPDFWPSAGGGGGPGGPGGGGGAAGAAGGGGGGGGPSIFLANNTIQTLI
jgi:hypothetical protein